MPFSFCPSLLFLFALRFDAQFHHSFVGSRNSPPAVRHVPGRAAIHFSPSTTRKLTTLMSMTRDSFRLCRGADGSGPQRCQHGVSYSPCDVAQNLIAKPNLPLLEPRCWLPTLNPSASAISNRLFTSLGLLFCSQTLSLVPPLCFDISHDGDRPATPKAPLVDGKRHLVKNVAIGEAEKGKLTVAAILTPRLHKLNAASARDLAASAQGAPL